MLAGRRVVLGVSGGIACYKACTVARRLAEAGAAVDTVLTRGAAEFVAPLTFETLTGRPVYGSLWEPGRALAHLELASGPDLIVVAPATAHLLARAAQGLADDLLTTLLLAASVPILAAPAMNDRMYAHPATAENVRRLKKRGWLLLGPGVGPLAEGPSDRPGRMVEPEEIVAHAMRLLRRSGSRLAGKRVVVTAGPTHEPLDAVRVLTNPSTGKMGFALAAAAFTRGAEVTLISGPTPLAPPPGVAVKPVRTTAEMAAAVAKALPRADVLLMAAAPADFRPLRTARDKRPRAAGAIDVSLGPTVDILESTRTRRRKTAVVVGFALEAGRDGRRRALEKLERKGLDLVVLNRADDPEGGFGRDTNRVTILTSEGSRALGVLPKHAVAEAILDEVERRL